MKITILIVDSDSSNTSLLAEALQKSRKVGDILTASHPSTAITAARAADLILIDPLLPGTDGVTFLHRLLLEDLHPGVFALSARFSQELQQELHELGVAHCMNKPVDISCLLRRIEAWNDGSGTRLGSRKLLLRRKISSILRELGMSQLSGYYDCCSAIEWLYFHGYSRGRITKELYPMIAGKTEQTTKQVERNIRYAIEQTWMAGDLETQEKYFGGSVKPDRNRPSNAVFLRTIAEYLRQTESKLDDDMEDFYKPCSPGKKF